MFSLKRRHFTVLIVTVFLYSCQKDVVPIENKPPVVDAGSSQLITADKDSVTLSGSAVDSDGRVVAYLWSQVSGPTKATIVNPGSASTIATSFSNGTYLFQLMATDEKGATGVDTVSIVLNRPTIKTLDLQPANNPFDVHFTFDAGIGNSTDRGVEDMPIMGWTKNGYLHNTRAIIKFDLSSIPATATIQSANLYLYSYPAPLLNGTRTDANYGPNNAMLVQQVTANWDPATVTPTTLPPVTTANQVIAPHTSQSFLDINLDITQQVKSMVTNNANYGFYFVLQNEVTYTSRIFVSSFNTAYPTKRPRLVVVFKK